MRVGSSLAGKRKAYAVALQELAPRVAKLRKLEEDEDVRSLRDQPARSLSPNVSASTAFQNAEDVRRVLNFRNLGYPQSLDLDSRCGCSADYTFQKCFVDTAENILAQVCVFEN